MSLQKYSAWKPTRFDTTGLNCADQQDWGVHPCILTRDSDALERSNHESALIGLAKVDTGNDDYLVARFKHWACGWFEVILVRPGTGAYTTAAQHKRDIEDYPVLNEDHLCKCEQFDADEVWRSCYTEQDRVAYIRDHSSDFEFHNMADLMGCVRGNYFAGVPSELLA